MNVIDMTFKVDIIPDGMLPVPALPQYRFAGWCPRNMHTPRLQLPREPRLYPTNAAWVIGIIRWQSDYAIPMIGKDDNRVDGERMARAFNFDARPKRINILDQDGARSVAQRHRQNIGAAWLKVSPI